MKNKFLFVGLALSAVIVVHSHADEKNVSSSKEAKMLLKTRDGFDFGVQSYWYKYEEEVNGAFFMSNTGKKYGLTATATKVINSEYYCKLDGRYATGDVEYESASGKGDVSDKVYEVRVLAGKEAIVENYLLSSYTGIGYRRLDNDLRDLGSGGYRRTSEYFYLPIGVTHRFLVNEISRISSSIEYDYFLKGEQKSYISDVSPVYATLFGDQVNKQKHGYGLKFNSAYEQKYWSLGVFLNYWHVGDSEVNKYIYPPFVYSFTEPKNETKEIGLELKLRF